MKDTILKRLKKIEHEHDVEILYAAESGSRAWGFASQDSDYDVRFIYKSKLKHYITINPKIKAVSSERGEVIADLIEGDLDFSGWDIFKSLRLLAKSNPPLIEWLHSPIKYIEKGQMAESMKEYIEKHYSEKSTAFHYLRMAKHNYLDYIKDNIEVLRKKYLYVLRPLIAVEWIKFNKTFPPTEFIKTIEGISLDSNIEEEIKYLVKDKKNNRELGLGQPSALLNKYISRTIDDFYMWAKTADTDYANFQELDDILHKELLKFS